MIEKIDISVEAESASKCLTASETIVALGISKQTLYSYVSRGRVRARTDPKDSRRRLYDAGDVLRILEVKQRGRARKAVAQSTIHWGEPILHSSLTNIADGRFFYRGQDAVRLSETKSLEDIACLLWKVKGLPRVSLMRTKIKGATPMERSLRAVADLATVPTGRKLEGIREATLLLRLMAAATAGTDVISNQPVHLQLARAWRVKAGGADLIRKALVLCADHELNASAYAVRVVASAGASLPASLLAGLAALSGDLHGGMTNRVAALMTDSHARLDLQKKLAALLKEKDGLPGFGHRLYSEGDPRAVSLLTAAQPSPHWSRFIAIGSRLSGNRPTVDVGLAFLQDKLSLPLGAGLGIFALGRTVGWIAHALEQRAEGKLIRPRAEFKPEGWRLTQVPNG